MKTRNKINRGFGIQTKSGHIFDPKSGLISEIDIEDIAHALSNLCRYAGHCRKFYSVAEHSVMVSKIIAKLWPEDRAAIRAGLLHDATEAYVIDLPTPIKVLVPEYMEIEDKLAGDIAKSLKINWGRDILDKVKTADMIALATEARLLFENVKHWDSIRKYESMIGLLAKGFPLAPNEAKKLFMREFIKLEKERLSGQRKGKQT